MTVFYHWQEPVVVSLWGIWFFVFWECTVGLNDGKSHATQTFSYKVKESSATVHVLSAFILDFKKIINGDNMTCWHLRVKMGMVWKDDGKENDLPIGGHLWGGKLAGIWQEELDINTHSHTHRHSQSRNDCHKVLVCVSWSNQCYPTILNHAWRIWVCLGHWFFQ